MAAARSGLPESVSTFCPLSNRLAKHARLRISQLNGVLSGDEVGIHVQGLAELFDAGSYCLEK